MEGAKVGFLWQLSTWIIATPLKIPVAVIMSISHLSLVNQKLAYAGAIIRLMGGSTAEPKAGHKLEQQALGDAAIFHLVTGLKFYLRELAEHHRIQNLSAINSAQELTAALQLIDRVSADSAELLTLVQTSDTWLNQLLSYYERLSKSPTKPKEKKAFEQKNLIELTEVEELPTLQLSPELLILWLDSFRALVIRQRETSAEY